jgi:hypothetical protein
MEAIARHFEVHPRTIRGALATMAKQGRLVKWAIDMPSWTLHSGHGDAQGSQPLTVLELRDPAPFAQAAAERLERSRMRAERRRARTESNPIGRPRRRHRVVPALSTAPRDAFIDADLPWDSGEWISAD